MSRLDRRSRQSQVRGRSGSHRGHADTRNAFVDAGRDRRHQVLEAVLSVATLCESGIAERALNKQAQKVKYVATDIVAEEPETPSGGGSNGGGNNPPGELEE